MSTGFNIINIKNATLENEHYRHVINTNNNLQLVLMCLKQNEDIPEEVHATHDQFIRIEEGKGIIIINGDKHKLSDDMSVMVPAGSKHYIKNTENKDMKLYTIYGPPQHPFNRINIRQPNKTNQTEKTKTKTKTKKNFKNKFLKYKHKLATIKKSLDRNK